MSKSPRWYPLVLADGAFNPRVADAAKVASGAYAIRRASDHEVMYVGESSRGALWRTLLRHFQAPASFRKVREGFVVSSPVGYEVALHVTSRGHRPRASSARASRLAKRGRVRTDADQRAMAAQARWIETLRPTLNKDDGLAAEPYQAPEEEDYFGQFSRSNPGPTFAQAREHMMATMEANGWDVKRHASFGGVALKTPHATHDLPDGGRIRVWFHPQTMHVQRISARGSFDAKHARSSNLEIRNDPMFLLADLGVPASRSVPSPVAEKRSRKPKAPEPEPREQLYSGDEAFWIERKALGKGGASTVENVARVLVVSRESDSGERLGVRVVRGSEVDYSGPVRVVPRSELYAAKSPAEKAEFRKLVELYFPASKKPPAPAPRPAPPPEPTAADVERVLQLVEAGRAHSLPVAGLSALDVAAAEVSVQRGFLRRLPARGRWPERFVVTSGGSHELGSFLSDDEHFRLDAREAGALAREARAAAAAAAAAKPSGYGVVETGKKRAGQLRMFNPPRSGGMYAVHAQGARPKTTLCGTRGRTGNVPNIVNAYQTKVTCEKCLALLAEREQRKNPPRKLVQLGLLTRLELADGSALEWSLREAPILAYDPAQTKPGGCCLVVCYRDGRVVRSSSAAELREYGRKHWGAADEGKVRDCGFAVGPFSSLGPSTSITYTTRKGADRKVVDYVHPWGEGSSRRCVPPKVEEHVCRGCGPRCAASGAIRLTGGTYSLEDRGIVG